MNKKILYCDNIEEAASKFQILFDNILEKYAPLKVYQSRSNYVPFLSHETKALMRERDALKEESTVQGCPILFNEYKVKRNKVKAMVQSDKINYYKSRLHDQSFDIKKVWKTVYNVLGNIDNKAPKQIRQGDRIINNPKLMAEALNKTFQDKVKKLRNQTDIQPAISFRATSTLVK